VFTRAWPLVPNVSQMNPDKPLSYLTKIHYPKIKVEPTCILHEILQQIAGLSDVTPCSLIKRGALCHNLKNGKYRFGKLTASFFFSVSWGGVRLSPLGRSATNWPIVPSPDDECGTMRIGKGNRSTRRKPAPMPLCPPQIPHDLTWLEPGPPRWEDGD
jgi:hypothetical protein